MISISQKQKELSKLQEQLFALQEELKKLETQNPGYKKRCDELERERHEILETLSQQQTLTVKGFVEIKYKWNGINKIPTITDYNFLLDANVNRFLVESLIEYGNLENVFVSDIVEVKQACSTLDALDKKVNSFNTKVNKSVKQFKEDYLKTLLI